ncbi:MAG: flippase-like domain-containing protein [Deltaproteobacteria bacterium]|nr:flippase-like domain-containing protein [Deltaproteobacteria bacterium]
MASAILWWLFHLYPIDQVVRAVRLVQPVGFVALALGYFLANWMVDCAGTASILTRLIAPISWRALLVPRAATYLLALINYGAGQAALALAVQRRRRAPLEDLLSTFFLITAADLFWIISLAYVGTFFGEHRVLGFDLTPSIRLVAAVTYLLTAAHLTYWLVLRPGTHGQSRFMRRLGFLHTKRIFAIFARARLRDYLQVIMVRSAIPCTAVLVIYALVHLFGAHIPFAAILGNVPIAFLIGVIPISWGGVGTSNKALVDLLVPHLQIAPDLAAGVSGPELLFAMSLLWMLGNYGLKACVGLLAWRRFRTETAHSYATHAVDNSSCAAVSQARSQ